MGFEHPNNRILRIKALRATAPIGLKEAVNIDNLYAESFDLSIEPLAEWERELLRSTKPEPYNWKLDMPWVVGTTSNSGLHYSLGRFADRQTALDFQTLLLDRIGGGTEGGTFVRMDTEL